MNKGILRRLFAEAVVALVWTALTLLTDPLIFDYNISQGRVWAYKGLFWILAFGLLHGAVTLVGKLRRKERFARRCVLWALPYLAVNLLLLLLIWPGAWGNDDLYVLELARSLQMTAWYHYLSSVYQILALMLIPLVAGTVFIQIVVISGMTGYLMASVQELVEGYCVARDRDPRRARWTAVLYLPLLLPPVLLHNQEPFRPTWTSWAEVFLLGVLAVWLAARKPLSRGKWWVLVCLGALTATWRSECIYYLFLMPVFFFLLAHRKQLGRVAAVTGSVLVILLALGSNRYNSALMGGSSWSYQSVAFVRQIYTAVRAADPQQDADLLAKIDPVFSVEACRESPGLLAGTYDEVIQPDAVVTDELWNDCLKASLQLAVRHPIPVLQERWNLFLDTMHYNIFSGQKVVFVTSGELYEKPVEELRDFQRKYLENLPPLGGPFNVQLRRQVINVLLNWKVTSNPVVSLSWNMAPFLGVLVVLQVAFAVRRKWGLFWINAGGILHIAVVFVSAPTSYFMYYLAPYMQGALSAGALLLWLILHIPARSKKDALGGNP